MFSSHSLKGSIAAEQLLTAGKPAASRTARISRGSSITTSARYSGSKGGGRGEGGGRAKTYQGESGIQLRSYQSSDGVQHLGSALTGRGGSPRPFPGPPPDQGPPLRILPIGGLGEIGMNCMLVGVRDRYILIDAGLMFPDFSDLGMQKILPDTSFLHQWRDKIEAIVITHGHEDHIGALPWVVPALDPSTPVYAPSFVMKLVERRLTEYSLFTPDRFRVFDMTTPFNAGPFEVQAIRVTHSIPDCCGLILRSEHGTIVHTGDWKIDETPQDGQVFDRTTFDLLGKEKVSLMMSDSTNVLSPGRTQSEKVVEQSIVNKVMAHAGKGRVICTQFASNLHRLASVKKAADASGRRIAFIGMSLNMYLDAAWKDGRAPLDPREILTATEAEDMDPNQLLIVTTGSQAEPRAALSMAARDASHQLKVLPNDLLLYSAKVIPGNEGRVTRMLNSLALQGARVVQGRADNLHVSGHAYQEELKEVLRYVKPQHFLPVHGEYAFLCEHARLAREEAGIKHCSVIKNGMMLGVHERSSRNAVSSGSLAQVVGEAHLINFYNDGGRGTGTAQEMALLERTTLAFEGVIVVAVDVYRPPPGSPQGLSCRVRLTTRGMWTDSGALLQELHEKAQAVVSRMRSDVTLATIERQVIDALKKAAKIYNNKRPEVICIAHEHDPRLAQYVEIAEAKRRQGVPPQGQGQQQGRQAGGPAAASSGGSSGDEDLGPAAAVGGGRQRAAAAKPWEQRAAAAPDAAASGGSRARSRTRSRSRDSDSEEVGAEDAEGGAGRSGSAAAAAAAGGSISAQLLEGRKLAAASRKRKPRAQADPSGGPPLAPLPEGVLEQRKAQNPRDAAADGTDKAFD